MGELEWKLDVVEFGSGWTELGGVNLRIQSPEENQQVELLGQAI